MSSKKPLDKKSLSLFAVVAVVFVVIALVALAKVKMKLANASMMPVVPVAVKTITVKVENIERTMPVLATVKSAATIQLKAETGGKILQMNCREGDLVKIGQVIALIDSREQDAQFQAAEARSDSMGSQVVSMRANLQVLTSQLAALETNLEFWNSEMKRADKLFKAGAMASNSYENARNRRAEAESRLAVLQSQIRSQKAQLDAFIAQKKASEKDTLLWQVRREYTEITAPVNGIVSARLQEAGNRVVPGTPIYNIEDTSQTRLIMQIPQESALEINLGQAVKITGFENNEFFVSRIYPVQNELRQVTVEAVTTGAIKGLIYDMQLPARVVVESAEGPVIPESARFVDFKDPGKFYVFVIDNDRAQRLSLASRLRGDAGKTLADSSLVNAGTELAVGAYLENVRLPASFAVEVIK
ncbi:MAG: biotin/lipoyl-binding protein [Erysipelotrichia bacterium]|nr:biotin/lipoyl-binding protein [Erysipelotrichia bacterium]